MLYLNEERSEEEGPEAEFHDYKGTLHQGRLVSRKRKVTFFGLKISSETKNYFRTGSDLYELKKPLPQQLLQNNRINVSEYISGRYTPLFPRLIIVLTFICSYFPFVPIYLLMAVKDYLPLLSTNWKKTYRFLKYFVAVMQIFAVISITWSVAKAPI